MASTINMQDMRYLNLFAKITQVNTRFCFRYNEMIIFCVPRKLISKAIGETGKNVKKLNEILGKKVKIIRKNIIYIKLSNHQKKSSELPLL